MPTLSGKEILDDLRWRGLLAQSTDEAELIKSFDEGRVTAYIGFDPTAPSLHVGNLVALLVLRRLQLAGHRPIGLVGGSTGLVGDPSGRSSERTLNETELVEEWVAKIRRQVERFLDFSDIPNAAIIANNFDWTKDVPVLSFLRDVGKYFSVNQMISKDSVSSRMESGGISYTEFSYQILQAFDYLELFRLYGCTLQMGGSDQWGNITAGLDLIRKVEQVSAHALTVPLLTKSDGTKFGKTASGSVWLDADLTSPYAFYQYWISTDDRDVISFLKIFTFLSRTEIQEIEESHVQAPERRIAQTRLARDLTTLVHGEDACNHVEAASQALFGRGDLSSLDSATLAAALSQVPQTKVEGNAPWGSLADLMAATGIVESKSAARRAIKEGGAYLNNAKIQDENFEPGTDDLIHGMFLVLRRGKREIGAVFVK